jgi:hypothetical protein
MPLLSEDALEAALRALSAHASARRAHANWLSTFLVASRMHAAGYGNSINGADEGVNDLFVMLPNHPLGRINPFVDLASGYRWGQVEQSGRKTVWNTGTRGGQQAILFNGNHFRNGLRSDAIDILVAKLGTGDPLPGNDALAVLVARDHDWESEPTRQELHRTASDRLDLSVEDFQRISSDQPLGVSLLGQPEWSPGLLAASELGPRADPLDVGTSPEKPDAPVESIQGLADDFTRFLAHYGVVVGSYEEVLDLLAATLSSQLLIMAGPSGSGKSLMASALSAFFAPKSRRCRLEAARLLAKREEFFGYFSYLAESTFVAYDPLVELLKITAADTGTPACVIIEEANLSPIEGYLSPLVHGLGGPQAEHVEIALHSQEGDVKSQVHDLSIPRQLSLTPFPRFFATINVDADSPAPARKVVSRSCVVLLEPPSFDVALAATASLVHPSVETADGPAAALIGRPAAAHARYVATGSDFLEQALNQRAELLRSVLGVEVIGPRQVLHVLMYMAWYLELAGITDIENSEEAVAVAVDNALLHFVLPSLPAAQFGKAVNPLAESATGLLRDRLERLTKALAAQHFGPPPDFWGALS